MGVEIGSGGGGGRKGLEIYLDFLYFFGGELVVEETKRRCRGGWWGRGGWRRAKRGDVGRGGGDWGRMPIRWGLGNS